MLKIETVKIEQIKENTNNAKEHTEEQIKQIMQSIKEFGFNDPIAIDENNVIIEGHGRFFALKKLNYKEVECIKILNLTEEQKAAYGIIHNKLTLTTGFDLYKLEIELNGIINIDMTSFGFKPEIKEWDPPELKEVELKPYKKVHYLISLDINDNDKILPLLDKIKKECDVDVTNTLS